MDDEVKDEIPASSGRLIDQPKTTKANAYSTLLKFSENAATTLNDLKRREDDFRHMNDHYGALVCDRIRSALAQNGIA